MTSEFLDCHIFGGEIHKYIGVAGTSDDQAFWPDTTGCQSTDTRHITAVTGELAATHKTADKQKYISNSKKWLWILDNIIIIISEL